MNNNVTTLETSQRLQAAGFPQGSTYFVISADLLNEGVILPRIYAQTTGIENYIAAPTAQEIADQLPPQTSLIYSDLSLRKRSGFGGYEASWRTAGVAERGDTMAEALAATWLALQEAK